LVYVPITTATWRRAAALWAVARNRGVTTAPPESLDGDVIVAAQALEEAAIILSTNVKHFERHGVTALEWTAVPLDERR
jgi:predicted nucleic acid-binding protein